MGVRGTECTQLYGLYSVIFEAYMDDGTVIDFAWEAEWQVRSILR